MADTVQTRSLIGEFGGAKVGGEGGWRGEESSEILPLPQLFSHSQ